MFGEDTTPSSERQLGNDSNGKPRMEDASAVDAKSKTKRRQEKFNLIPTNGLHGGVTMVSTLVLGTGTGSTINAVFTAPATTGVERNVWSEQCELILDGLSKGSTDGLQERMKTAEDDSQFVVASDSNRPVLDLLPLL